MGKDVVVRPTSAIASLHAFAELYGTVRWFHPSDAAAAANWDRIAIDGTRRLIAGTQGDLREALAQIFREVAPTVQVANRAFADASLSGSDIGTASELVAWQHRGFGDSVFFDPTVMSKRTHRDERVAVGGASFAALWQGFDAAPYHGRKVRLRGKLRAAQGGRARLWLRVDRGDSGTFFDNMSDRPVTSAGWSDAEIVGVVGVDATRLVIGTLISGRGVAWYDGLELSVQSGDGAWTDIPVADAGFESGAPLSTWGVGTGRSPGSIEGWDVEVDQDSPAEGKKALRVQTQTKLVHDELFAYSPNSGEVADVELGSGLRARVPLTLPSVAGHTLGDKVEDGGGRDSHAELAAASGFDVVTGVADVIVTWNVFKHFWPYMDPAGTSWDAVLDTAISDALDDRTLEDHVLTLERMLSNAPDGHVDVMCPTPEEAYPPFSVRLIERQVVVVASREPSIVPGDVVVSVDGKASQELFAAEAARISGSPQWKTYRASRRFGRGATGSTLHVHLRHGGLDREVAVALGGETPPSPPERAGIERLSDGVYYLNMARVTKVEVETAIAQLSAAPGLVVDMREAPYDSEDFLLQHLLTQANEADHWEGIPLIIRPNQPSTPAGWDTSDTYATHLPALQPHIAGRVAFLIGPGAISYAETILSLIEYHRLGALVGTPTAGTNGNVADIQAPSGCKVRFTGRRVLKPDGSRFHLIGVLPTIPVESTIAGVVGGRDEVLEAGLAYVRDAKH